jgi:signal transduction histidine kinase
VRELSPREAARGHPVHVTGVITYSAAETFMQFFHDGSTGIYVALDYLKSDIQLAVGQKVELTGFSGPGDYAPIIYAERIRLLGAGSMPPSHPATLPVLMTGAEDSQWVTIRGIVHEQSSATNETTLKLWTSGAAIQVTVSAGAPKAPSANLVDAAVQVTGVCATIFNEKRRLQGVRIYVPDWSRIEIKEAAPPDPFDLDPTSIKDLYEFRSENSALHRVHIQGSVILRQAGSSLFVQDDSAGILVRPRLANATIPENALVDIVGFPGVSDRLPILQDAIVRVLARNFPVSVVGLSPDKAPDEELHARLVQVKALVLADSRSTEGEMLTLQFGPNVIEARLVASGREAPLPRCPPGSLARLTGVLVARPNDQRHFQSFQLLLRSPNDVVVLSRPTWWTTRNAAWIFGTLTSVLLVALAWVGLLRRQVQVRTKELRQEIDDRKRAEAELKQAQQALVQSSRLAGMAEVATSVLHNVGNVLNSVNVSATLIAERVRGSRSRNLGRAAALLTEHNADLEHFLTTDPKGRQLPDYLGRLSEQLARDQASVLAEAEALRTNIQHIKNIITTQQSYAKVSGLTETVQMAELVDDALRVKGPVMAREQIEIVRAIEPALPSLEVDRHKVLQILVNLLQNAQWACEESGRPDKRVSVRATNGDGRIKVSVADNGIGIPPENLTRIFQYGFTTRRDGHGFGLHSGALAAKEMGGRLAAESPGPGLGATFTLELPSSPTARRAQ